MTTAITQGIKVSVVTRFQPELSNADNNHYLFAYKILITNESDYTMQLLSRHWFIFDSWNEHREVEGEGVVGKQPVLAPGESFEYVSSCNLHSDMGTMHGTFYMQRQVDEEIIPIDVPKFDLVSPYRNN